MLVEVPLQQMKNKALLGFQEKTIGWIYLQWTHVIFYWK
jgi:hypothetical protein